MSLPTTAAANFKLLTDAYRERPIEFPHLKAVTLAQWGLESGWGKTGLAKWYLNYAGMKWGPTSVGFGTPVFYADKQKYVHFTNLTLFIDAYWARLDDVSLYYGWRGHTGSSQSFITYITPPWLTGRRSDGKLSTNERKYVRDILNIHDNRTDEIFSKAGEPAGKPLGEAGV